jgi:hypothetical protein
VSYDRYVEAETAVPEFEYLTGVDEVCKISVVKMSYCIGLW